MLKKVWAGRRHQALKDGKALPPSTMGLSAGGGGFFIATACVLRSGRSDLLQEAGLEHEVVAADQADAFDDGQMQAGQHQETIALGQSRMEGLRQNMKASASGGLPGPLTAPAL